MDVEGGTGEGRVVVAFFAEGRPKANIDFVGLPRARWRWCSSRGCTGFDALDERPEDFVEMRDVRNVEDFAAGLFDDFADIHKARCHGRGHARFRGIVAGDFQVVDHCVGSDGFGDDLARVLAASAVTSTLAAGLKAADHVGDLGFVVPERDAHLGFGRKGEKGHLVFWLEGA